MLTPGLALRFVDDSPLGELWRAGPRERGALAGLLRPLGYEAVELEAAHLERLGGETGGLQSLRTELDSAGLAVSAVSAGSEQREGAELAREIGARSLHLSPDGFAPVTAENERALVARLAEYWKHVISVADTHHVRVYWDPWHSPPEHTFSVVEQVLSIVDDPSFGIVFDTGDAESLAGRTTHEVVFEGRRLTGALGLHERFKGSIGAVRLSEPRSSADGLPPALGRGGLDWGRLLPALVDAWIPARWWTIDVGCHDIAFAREAAQFFESRVLPLYPETIATASRGAGPDAPARTTS
jgi:sugar phosphate isomerase/epimerase